MDKAIQHLAKQHLDEYDCKLVDLGRQFADFQRRNQELIHYEARPSLFHRVLDGPIPSRFRMVQLNPYDGTTDLLDHLKNYKALIQV